jgi:6-phosphofructokinase 1
MAIDGSLGHPIRRVASPHLAGSHPPFVDDRTRVLASPLLDGEALRDATAFELAGPRERVVFGPEARCGILTAGGMCPGLNDVIRGLVLALHHAHGVGSILGIRHGFEGLSRADARPLVPADVRHLHERGGTLLGTARSRHDVARSVAGVRELGLDVLFCVGGDGTLRGALALDRELEAAAIRCGVVAIPKTIDNDIPWCTRTFGFDTAVAEAARAIAAAHVEATGVRNGVGIVQLMGRHSGFIAAHASLACPDVNFCLVPEVPFAPQALAAAVSARLASRGHAVIVVAEGAGEESWEEDEKTHDASGNVKLPPIGPKLKSMLEADAATRGDELVVKLIDPSYMIRSTAANASDHVLCNRLARVAAHAAMAGKTGLMVAELRDEMVHVPLSIACSRRRRLDPASDTWRAVLASTGQPALGQG